jgi:hypothetical protein
MADLMAWTEMMNRDRAMGRASGRELLTESFGQQKAFRDKASFAEGVEAGREAVSQSRDPLFKLKELQLKLGISHQAAVAADHFRELQLTSQKIQFEQEDQNFFTQAAQQANGDLKAYKSAVLDYSPKSLRGMDEQRIKLNALYKEESDSELTKMFGKLDIQTQLAVKEMLAKNDGEWTPEIYEFARQNVAAAEAAKLKTQIELIGTRRDAQGQLIEQRFRNSQEMAEAGFKQKKELVDYRTDAQGRLIEQRFENTQELMQSRNEEFSSRLAQKYENDLKLIDAKDEKAKALLQERYRLANEAGQMTSVTTIYPEKPEVKPDRTGWPWDRKDVPGTGSAYEPARRETVKQNPTAAKSSATGMGDVRQSEAVSTEKVRVQHPDGTIGFIPAEQKDAALKAGYKIIE